MPAHRGRVRLSDERGQTRQRGVDDGGRVSGAQGRREAVVGREQVLVGAVLEDDGRGAHRGDEGALRQRGGGKLVAGALSSVAFVVVVAVVAVLGDQLDLGALCQSRLVELVEAVEERGPVVEVALFVGGVCGVSERKKEVFVEVACSSSSVRIVDAISTINSLSFCSSLSSLFYLFKRPREVLQQRRQVPVRRGGHGVDERPDGVGLLFEVFFQRHSIGAPSEKKYSSLRLSRSSGAPFRSSQTWIVFNRSATAPWKRRKKKARKRRNDTPSPPKRPHHVDALLELCPHR